MIDQSDYVLSRSGCCGARDSDGGGCSSHGLRTSTGAGEYTRGIATGRFGGPPAEPAQTPATRRGAPAAPTIASAALPRDLSPWGMFLNADIVVKVVMVGLDLRLARDLDGVARQEPGIVEARRGTRRAALAVLNEARSLAEANARLGDSSEAVARLLRTAVHEVQISPHPDPESLKERVSWLLERVEASASRRIGRGMGLLASIGATAPFVGLFGTVWGIMNSFIGISNAHTTNLAVVAPGIAEALLATALGLFAAIPGGRDLQRVLARDRRLSRAARGWLGAGDAAVEPRLRARVRLRNVARGGVAPWPSVSDTKATISRKPTRSTSRRSST